MKKIDKLKYGEMLLYLNRTVNHRLKSLRGQIVSNACNSNYLACENTLMQIKYILRDIDRKSILEEISLKLAASLNTITAQSRGMIKLLCLNDLDMQSKLREIIYDKVKFKTNYYRMIDKALTELFDSFFSSEEDLAEFVENCSGEPLVQIALKYARGEKTCSRRNEKVLFRENNTSL